MQLHRKPTNRTHVSWLSAFHHSQLQSSLWLQGTWDSADKRWSNTEVLAMVWLAMGHGMVFMIFVKNSSNWSQSVMSLAWTTQSNNLSLLFFGSFLLLLLQKSRMPCSSSSSIIHSVPISTFKLHPPRTIIGDSFSLFPFFSFSWSTTASLNPCSYLKV